MKTVTFDQALVEFRQLYQLAASGETVVIEQADQRVALQSMRGGLEVAPPGYFAEDYSSEEIADLNRLGSQGPQTPVL